MAKDSLPNITTLRRTARKMMDMKNIDQFFIGYELDHSWLNHLSNSEVSTVKCMMKKWAAAAVAAERERVWSEILDGIKPLQQIVFPDGEPKQTITPSPDGVEKEKPNQ